VTPLEVGLGFGQPESHVHLAEECGGSAKVACRAFGFSFVATDPPEREVALGGQWA